MLCCVKENGQTKCDQYWPLEVEEQFDYEDSSISVTLISVESILPNLL